MLFSPAQLLDTPTCRQTSQCVRSCIRLRTPSSTSAHSHTLRSTLLTVICRQLRDPLHRLGDLRIAVPLPAILTHQELTLPLRNAENRLLVIVIVEVYQFVDDRALKYIATPLVVVVVAVSTRTALAQTRAHTCSGARPCCSHSEHCRRLYALFDRIEPQSKCNHAAVRHELWIPK